MKVNFFYALIFLLLFSSSLFGQNKKIVDNGYEKGILVDGFKEGLWSYYDNDTLKIQINYSTGKLMYLQKDTSGYAILTDKGWEISKLDIYPHYLGSTNELLQIISNNIRYPAKARINSTRGTVLIGFEVNLKGKIENLKIIKDIGRGCGSEVIKAFAMVPDYWLVAQKNHKRYKSRYILPVKFKIGKIKKGKIFYKKDSKREIKKIQKAKSKYSPANYLPEITVTAVAMTRR